MQHCFNGVLMAELMNVDLVLVEKAALGWKELSLVFFGVGVDWCCLPEFDDLARWPMSGTVVSNIRKSLKVNEVRIWRWLWDQFELASAKPVVLEWGVHYTLCWCKTKTFDINHNNNNNKYLCNFYTNITTLYYYFYFRFNIFLSIYLSQCKCIIIINMKNY